MLQSTPATTDSESFWISISPFLIWAYLLTAAGWALTGGQFIERTVDRSVIAEPLLQATHTVPIVFTIVADPVGSGLVDSLAHPGGNATGFMQFEYSLCGKWLELLKEVVPGVTRAAVLRDSADTSGIGQLAVIQSVAPSVGVDVSPVNMGDATEFERAVTAFASSSNGGLIIPASGLAVVRRNL